MDGVYNFDKLKILCRSLTDNFNVFWLRMWQIVWLQYSLLPDREFLMFSGERMSELMILYILLLYNRNIKTQIPHPVLPSLCHSDSM